MVRVGRTTGGQGSVELSSSPATRQAALAKRGSAHVSTRLRGGTTEQTSFTKLPSAAAEPGKAPQ